MNNLSKRQKEVAELVARGLSNKEVANQLFMTEKTVKFHLTNIYKLLNVKNRTQLSVYYHNLNAGAILFSSAKAQIQYGNIEVPAEDFLPENVTRHTKG